MSAPKKKLPSRQAGAKVLVGSQAARQAAAVVLESVTGLCSVEEASARLSVAVPRYYVLETRALQGLIGALEPRPRGFRPVALAGGAAGLAPPGDGASPTEIPPRDAPAATGPRPARRGGTT